jgi:hypothetical protein
MKNLMVLMVNLLEANPKHVYKTSWNLRTTKEHLRNFSSKNSKNFTKKGARKEMFWGLGQ